MISDSRLDNYTPKCCILVNVQLSVDCLSETANRKKLFGDLVAPHTLFLIVKLLIVSMTEGANLMVRLTRFKGASWTSYLMLFIVHRVLYRFLKTKPMLCMMLYTSIYWQDDVLFVKSYLLYFYLTTCRSNI